MSDPSSAPSAAYEEGRRTGLAIAAFALAIMSFINLLGVEKSILALVLAVIAMYGAPRGAEVRRWSRNAIGLAAVHIVIFVVFIVLFHQKLGQLILLLQKLG
jgi:hypothetical protein